METLLTLKTCKDLINFFLLVQLSFTSYFLKLVKTVTAIILLIRRQLVTYYNSSKPTISHEKPPFSIQCLIEIFLLMHLLFINVNCL